MMRGFETISPDRLLPGPGRQHVVAGVSGPRSELPPATSLSTWLRFQGPAGLLAGTEGRVWGMCFGLSHGGPGTLPSLGCSCAPAAPKV